MTMYAFNPASVLLVLVPRVRTDIAPGSGIVGIYARGLWRVYYEGNKFGLSYLDDVHGRLSLAAGRLLTQYPTVARELVLEEDFGRRFLTVGEYTPASETLMIEPRYKDIWHKWVEEGALA